MDRNRIMLILAALAVVIVVVGGYLFGIQPQFQAASDARSQIVSVRAQNDAQIVELRKLVSDYRDMDGLKSELAVLNSSVPDEADLPAFLRQLDAMADSNGVSIASIATSTSVAYSNPDASSTATAATATTGGATPTATPTPTPTPAAAATASTTETAPLPAGNALVTSANFTAVPMSITVQGRFDQALGFLKSLQDGERLFLVTSVDHVEESKDSEDPPRYAIGGFIYVLDSADAVQAGTAQTTTTTTQAQAEGK